MSMLETRLKIRIFGDPALRNKARVINRITERHREELSQMARLMYDASGIGLAASQVAVAESMIVIDIGSGLYKLINPKVVKREGVQALEEGCLSIPGVCIKVKRARKIRVEDAIFDGEAIGIDPKNGTFMPFQDTAQRKRKHNIAATAKKVPVKYFAFDILYLNGESLLNKSFRERRKILERIIKQI